MVVQHPVNCEALPGPALSNRSLWQRRAKLASLQALWPWRSDFNLNGYTSVPPKWNGNYTVQKAHEEETAGYGEASTSLPVLRGTLEKHLPRLDPGEAWLLQEGLQGPTVCGVHNLFNSYFWGCFLETTGYITLHEVEVMKTQLSSSSVKKIWKKRRKQCHFLTIITLSGENSSFHKNTACYCPAVFLGCKGGYLLWSSHMRTTIVLSGRSWSEGIWADTLGGGLKMVWKMYFTKYEYMLLFENKYFWEIL